MKLPINPKKLLESDLIEKERLELKKGFNPESIIHKITAFANDFNNWGGGYILIGVNDNKEVEGINKYEIDSILKKIIELCNKINPTYFPVIEPFEYNNKHILILYCPGGSERPYKAPKSLVKPYYYKLYIRHGSCTVIANSKEEIELINSSVIPFDDRINHKADIDDLDDSLINKYLKETNLNLKELSKIDICKSLNIVDGSKEYLKPKNIGILMFCKTP
jgi:ATP-dependent DNA helicase RecG